MSIFDLLQQGVQGVQGLVNSIPKAAESPEELARKNADRHRPIGSVAYRNGKKVLWAGQRYDYQSPEMYKQLQDKGEFKFLNITGHQIREGALSIIPRETKDAVKEQISNTSKLLAEGDLALKDLSEVYNPGSTKELNQRREKASEAVSAVTTPLSNASKWFSDKTNTAPWVSDEVGAALITGGTSLIARRFMQAAKLANTARKISSTADKVTTTANQARQLGKFSNNAIMRAKLGGAAAQRVKQSGSANLSNIVDLKDKSLTYLNKVDDAAATLRRINRLKRRGKLTGSQINAAITPEGVLNRYGVYRKNPITGKKERVPLPDESALPTLGRKDQHHLIPKDTRHDFTQQANKLDPKGQAALDAIDVEYGLQAGGGEKGVTTMDMAAHLPLHGRIRSAGYELSGDQLKAFKKEIAGIKDIEQLKVVYRDWLEKNVIPTLNTVTALQGGYELLEASGGKVTKEALLNAAYGRGGWMDRQLSVVENRIDAAIQAGRAPRRADILFKARAEQDALNDLF
jgi:hypothetical protein